MRQIRITKKERENVLKKYGCTCAYCGNPITNDTMYLDAVPNSINPSCRRCKRRKQGKTIEQFRAHIKAEHHRLQYKNSKYSLCRDFGMIADVTNDVIFNFEKYKTK